MPSDLGVSTEADAGASEEFADQEDVDAQAAEDFELEQLAVASAEQAETQ